MIRKKIYITQINYRRVLNHLLQNQSSSKFEKRANSHCIHYPNGVSIRILSIQNGTKITISKRTDRNNEHHFLEAVDLIEKKLYTTMISIKNYGEIQ